LRAGIAKVPDFYGLPVADGWAPAQPGASPAQPGRAHAEPGRAHAEPPVEGQGTR
jgi:hypothetical protein